MQFEEEGKARENEVFYVKSVRVRMNTESKKKNTTLKYSDRQNRGSFIT